jgi:cyclase
VLRNRIIPCLLLTDSGLVKTTCFTDRTYIGDPINAVKIFNDKEVDELILLDIDATQRQRGPDLARLRTISSQAFMPVAYGGGISSMSHIADVLSVGFEKVVINTHAVSSPPFVEAAAKRFGTQCIVSSIDAKIGSRGNYEVMTRSGTTHTGIDVLQFAKQIEDRGAGEIFLNSVDRDGTRHGYDLRLIKLVTSTVGVPVIACGGAGSLSDLGLAITVGGASAVAAGSLFVFHGAHRAVLISFPERLEREIP